MRKFNPPLEDLTIAVVYLLYPTGPRYNKEKPIRALKQILTRLPGRKITVYVDNSVQDSTHLRQPAPDEYEIGGDNRFLEFSGWQHGIDFLTSRGVRPDLWLFVNDTFLTQSILQRFALTSSSLECALVHSAIVGKRMSLSPPAEIMGNPLTAYIRTHFFLMSAQIAERLGSIMTLDAPALDRLLLSEFDPSLHLFKRDAPLSEETRHVIFSHLTDHWYRKKPYSAEHFQELRAKAISILNSFLLSLRIDQLGFPLISYTKADSLLAPNITPDRVRADWLNSVPSVPAPPAVSNRFWMKRQYAYKHVPQKKRAFTLSNLLDLIENRPGKEHM